MTFTSISAQLTLQTRKRYSSVAPKNFKELRAKNEVMANMWLLAQLRQPGRSVFSDLEPTTFQKFLKQLLCRRRFKGSSFHRQAASIASLTSLSFEEKRTSNAESQLLVSWPHGGYHNQQHLSDALVAAGEFPELPVRKFVVGRSSQGPEGNLRGKGRGGKGAQALLRSCAVGARGSFHSKHNPNLGDAARIARGEVRIHELPKTSHLYRLRRCKATQ